VKRSPRECFTIWRMMVAVAAVALVLGMLVADEGARLVRGIYAGVDVPIWTIRVSPIDRMTVR